MKIDSKSIKFKNILNDMKLKKKLKDKKTICIARKSIKKIEPNRSILKLFDATLYLA
jgi:hypothetical protein